MGTLLAASGIDNVVLGRRVMPGDSAAETEAKQAWLKDNATAMLLISTSLEVDQLNSLLMCETAKEMWDKLTRIYEHRSAADVRFLMQRFYGYHQMGSADSVANYIAQIRNMARQILESGESCSDTMIMAKILSGLPPKFTEFKTAYHCVDPARQTVENLEERLIAEEYRLNAGSRDKKDRRNNNTVECYRCERMGHYARDCPRKQKQDDRRYCSPSIGQRSWLLKAGMGDVWCIDSRAPQHITYRREWLSDFRSSRGMTVSLGLNGVHGVAGKGTVHIEKLVDGVWGSARLERVLYVPTLRKNLFSLSTCTSRGLEVEFSGANVKALRDNKIVLFGAKQEDQMYRMYFRVQGA